jgi:hypothetical protein
MEVFLLRHKSNVTSERSATRQQALDSLFQHHLTSMNSYSLQVPDTQKYLGGAIFKNIQQSSQLTNALSNTWTQLFKLGFVIC